MTRKFEIKAGEQLGEIKDISLNSDGKKLVLLADQVPFGSIRIPDTQFYVYDIDMDKFLEFKCSPSRMPIEAYWDQTDPRLLAVETEYSKQASSSGEGTPGAGGKTVQEIDVKDFDKKDEDIYTGKSVETFFVTTDYGVKR